MANVSGCRADVRVWRRTLVRVRRLFSSCGSGLVGWIDWLFEVGMVGTYKHDGNISRCDGCAQRCDDREEKSVCARLDVRDAGGDPTCRCIVARCYEIFFRVCFGWLKRLVVLLQSGQRKIDLNGDLCGRVVVVCCNGFFDLRCMVKQRLVQSFELVLAVIDVVCSPVDGGGAKLGE